MKKILFSLALAVILVSGFGWESPAAPAPAPIVLKQSMYPPAGHPYTVGAMEFAEWVAKATGGRVKIEVYPAASLCPANQELAAAHAGTIDMTLTVTTYLTGMVPLLNYTGLPWFSPPTKEAVGKVNSEVLPILEKAMQAYNVRLLMTSATPNNYCLVTRKEIRNPADLKGLKIRTAGGLTDKLAVNWGAAVVSLPVSETYSALQRGLVDATILTIPSVKGMRIYEVAPYVTDLGMGMNAFLTMVNKDKWNKISPADQKAILGLIPEYVVYRTGTSMKDVETARAEWPGLGVKVYVPTPSELQQWKAGAKPLWEGFTKSSPEAKKIVDILIKNGGGIH